MDLQDAPVWFSKLVSEVGIPSLLSQPSTMLSQQYHKPIDEIRQARLMLVSEAKQSLRPVSAMDLLNREKQDKSALPLSLACPILDSLLCGGIPRRGLTELAGESGAGKTQLCLQLALETARATEQTVVYVCTEDAFPAKRLEQLRGARRLSSEVTDRILVEHAADVATLQQCCERRLPLLAARRPLSLLVLDSVAALFRAEYTAADGLRRSRDLHAIATCLRRLSRKHGMAVLCVNQVTALVAGGVGRAESGGGTAPALGLAWASQLGTRLMAARTDFTLPTGSGARLMQLRVVSAPHLPVDTAYYQIESDGVHGRAICENTGLTPLPD